MFGGMPTYQIITVSEGNYLRNIDKALQLYIHHPIGRFFAAMVGFYIMLVVLGVNPWLAFAGAVGFGLTTNNLILYEAGHLTKLQTISYFPLIIAGLLLAFNKKKYLWGGIVFSLGLGLAIYSNHIQMAYYLALTLVIFGIAQLIADFRAGEALHFLKATGVILIGAVLAVGSAANNLMVTYEYSRDTMRGEPILQAEGAVLPGSSSETEGLAWDYAMQWSNGGIDLFASFIPGVAGGGTQERVSSRSPLYDDPNWTRAVLQPSGGYAPLYWGALPFTSGPIYFGAAVFFFFLMGLVLVEGPVKWWLGLSVFLTFLLSLGKNLEDFNMLFFDFVPLYNKFRTPNSVLSVTAFLVPLLGFLALGRVLSGKVDKEKIWRSIKIAGGTAAAVCLYFAVLGPSMFDFSAPGDARYIEAGLTAEPLIEARKYLMRMDALRSLLFVALSAAFIWAYLNRHIKKPLLLTGLALIVLVDIWTVDKRYLNDDNFVEKRGTEHEANIPLRPADEEIFKLETRGRGFYRVLDLTSSPFASTATSYRHNSLGGYHAAKLQRYQDIIDRHLQPGLMRLSRSLQGQATLDRLHDFLAGEPALNMLNAKYLILNENGPPTVNPHALGNAWFIDDVYIVNSPNAEIDTLEGLAVGSIVVVHEEFADYLAGFDPQKGGTIELVDYKPNHLTYRSEAGSEQFAVFSEIWYGPDKGWQAYLDGEPVDHIRVNYLLRGMRVPAGQHTVEFRFEPKTYETGRRISQASSLLILLLLIGYGGYSAFRTSQEIEEEEEREIKKPEAPARNIITPRNPAARKKKGKGGKRK
jgi:hypothetical protein